MLTDYEQIEVEFENVEAYSPDDPPEDPPEVMRSLLRKQQIDKLIDTFIRWLHAHGCSSDAAIQRTYQTTKRAFRQVMEDYRAKMPPEERDREAAGKILLMSKYPDALRLDMLKAYDEERYRDVLIMSAAIDSKERSRPNSGKKGPENPTAVKTDIHIDFDQLAAEIISDQIQQVDVNYEPKTPIEDQGCKGRGFRRVRDSEDIL